MGLRSKYSTSYQDAKADRVEKRRRAESLRTPGRFVHGKGFVRGGDVARMDAHKRAMELASQKNIADLGLQKSRNKGLAQQSQITGDAGTKQTQIRTDERAVFHNKSIEKDMVDLGIRRDKSMWERQQGRENIALERDALNQEQGNVDRDYLLRKDVFQENQRQYGLNRADDRFSTAMERNAGGDLFSKGGQSAYSSMDAIQEMDMMDNRESLLKTRRMEEIFSPKIDPKRRKQLYDSLSAEERASVRQRLLNQNEGVR